MIYCFAWFRLCCGNNNLITVIIFALLPTVSCHHAHCILNWIHISVCDAEKWGIWGFFFLHLSLVHMLFPLPDVFCILSTPKTSLVHRASAKIILGILAVAAVSKAMAFCILILWRTPAPIYQDQCDMKKIVFFCCIQLSWTVTINAAQIFGLGYTGTFLLPLLSNKQGKDHTAACRWCSL